MKIWKIGIILNLVSTVVLIGMQLYYESIDIINLQETIVEFETPPLIIKPVEVVFEDLSVDENLPIIKRKNKKIIPEEKKKTPRKKPQTKENIKRASWYGPRFHGRKTANGKTYNMYAVSAAHKTLPIGTWIRVVNLKNNKYVDLQINDRGPFIRGRDLDLSYGAAKELGMIETGVVPVKISLL